MSDRDSKKTRLSDIHQNNCGDVESGVCSQEKDFTSSLIEITDVSPLCFEYHGWSEEGINLCVDLNSSPSYWANKYRNEVCVSENVCMMNECRSLLQDLGCLGGSSSQGKGINEKQSTALGLVRYAAPNNYLSGAESCAEDVSEKTLKAINTPFIKFICGSETLKHHDSNPGDEIFEDGGLPDLVDPKNDLVVEQGNSREIDLDTDVKNIPSFAEEEEVGKNVKGRENSECYQFDEPLEKCGDQEYKMKHQKKNRHSKGQSCSDKGVGMFLRSMKKSVTVRPRRSTRLFSKVLQQSLH